MSKEFFPPPADLAKVVETVPNFKFYIAVSRWVGDMPGWKGMLSDKDIENLSHYIRTFGRLK